MNAALALLRYLEAYGEVELVQPSELPIGSSADRNVVFVANPRSINGQLGEILSGNSFYIEDADPTVIRNRSPRPGEPTEIRGKAESSQRQTCPGIIMQLPKNSGGTGLLLLLGRFSTALSSFLVSQEGLQMLDQQWIAGGRPEAWEMAVQAEIHGETILRVWPVAFHSLSD
jgi:hypothetical protein